MSNQTRQWIHQWPELETRPNLIQYLEENPKFRTLLFRWLDRMSTFASMVPAHLRSRALELEYEENMRVLRKRKDELGHRVFNECIGFLKNAALNIRIRKLNCPRLAQNIRNPHYVLPET